MDFEEEINANTELIRKFNRDIKSKINDLKLSNTAKILNQNKIVADYGELKAQIQDVGERITDLEVEKIYDPTEMKMDIKKLKKILEKILINFSKYDTMRNFTSKKLLKELEGKKDIRLMSTTEIVDMYEKDSEGDKEV
jgi:ribose 5-phosphate isomerase